MKTRFSKVILVVSLTAVAATAFATYSKSQPTFRVYGVGALTTTASDGMVAAARHDAHKALGNWTADKDGRSSDASFQEAASSWSSHTGNAGAISRGKTTFTDKEGHHAEMEVVENHDAPTLVFLSNDGGPQAQAALLNAFISSLQKQGVKPVFN